MKKFLSVLLAAAMMLTLAACSEEKVTFDAQSYVQAVLDAKYHQEYAEYAKQIGVSEAEAKEQLVSEFNASLQEGLEQTGMITSDEQVEQYLKMEADLRLKVQYEVHEAVEDEDGNYTVDVTVTPCNGYVLYSQNFYTDLQNAVNDGATEADYMDVFLTCFQYSIDNAPAAEATTYTMHVTYVEEGKTRIYTITEADVLEFDMVATGNM